MRPPTLLALLLLAGCRQGPGAILSVAGWNAAALARPIAPAPRHAARARVHGARLAVTWLGHATALVQLDDKLVLTDPLLCSSAGLLSKRLVAPGLTARELPPLDAVVVSHMHFDHLSYDTLFALKRKVAALLLPPGGSSYVPDYGFPQVELERFQTWEQDGLKVTGVPTQHVGWRWGLDALWKPGSFSGYVIEYHGLAVYYSGDTAYDAEAFRAIRERFPHLDLALLPIAPIAPREFMSHTHVDPGEALQAFADVGAERMIPVHYDTFINSLDVPGDATAALEQAMAERGLSSDKVVRLEIGEQRVLLPAGPGVTGR